MDFKRPKLGIFWLGLVLALGGCSDFRAVFNGKPQAKVAKKSLVPAKKKNQPAPVDAKGLFIWPLNAPVSSLYGKRKRHFHDGIDIDGEKGDPIVAAAAGKVVYSGRLGGYGNLIVLRHANGYFTAYAHNKKNLVEKGTEVKKGQLIAQVGKTGSASGYHLHFEIRDQKGTYDPLDFLPQHRYSQNR